MLITVQDVKDFLGITITDDDDKIWNACLAAQEEAETFCDRKFDGQSFTEYYDGDGTSVLQLRNYPINAVTSIYDDIDRVYGADTLIDSDDYAINTDTGIIELVGLAFCKGAKNIKATYTAGYGGSGYAVVPFDLAQSLVFKASAIYLAGKAGVNVMEGQEMVYRPNYLTKQAQEIWNRYRRLTI